MSNAVFVYILTEDPDSTQTRLLMSSFNNEIFTIKVVTIDIPPAYTNGNMSEEKAREYYRFSWILKNSKEETDGHIIILKDTSVTNTDSNTIADIVQAIKTLDTCDICYLCRWLDKCDSFKNKAALANKTTIMARSMGPQGFQAYLISPKGRDILLAQRVMANGKRIEFKTSVSETLKREISEENIIANVVLPNLFEFDVTKVRNDRDYLKLSECETRPNSQYILANPLDNSSQINTSSNTVLQSSVNSDKPQGPISWLSGFMELLGKNEQIKDTRFINSSAKSYNEGSSFMWMIIILLIGFGVYFMYKRKKEKTTGPTTGIWLDTK